MKPVWKRSALCSSRMRSLVPGLPKGWEGCSIGKGTDGSSSTSMALDRPHDNALCLKVLICHHPRGVCSPSVHLATWDANAERSCAPARRCCRPISIAGWQALEAQAMEIPEGSCCAGLRSSSPTRLRWVFCPPRPLFVLSGLYGNGAIVVDLIAAAVGWVMRSKDYGLLDLPEVKVRLALPADEQFTHPESGLSRDLFDCGALPVTAEGHRSRLIVATHRASTSPVGVIRDGIVCRPLLHRFTRSRFHRRGCPQAVPASGEFRDRTGRRRPRAGVLSVVFVYQAWSG